MKVDSVSEQMGVKLLAGTLQTGPLTVGADAEVRRGSEVLGQGLVTGVMVGGKMLDQAGPGDSIQIMLRGSVAPQVGDEIYFS